METITTSIPFPCCGNSKWMAIIQTPNSERPPNPNLFISTNDLPHMVIAGAFLPDYQIVLPTPLPPPHDKIVLPPLTKQSLRPEIVRDENGRTLGTKIVVPSTFVWANIILTRYKAHDLTYDYASAVRAMVKESCRLLGGVINRGIIRVRERPCLMGHALELSELAADEVGISEEFAGKVLSKVQALLPLRFGSVWDMDGFPAYFLRFPVASRGGIQSGLLRILKGKGRFVGCNPWNLSKNMLGDRDGDAIFVLLRCKDLQDGVLEMAKRPRIVINQQIKKVNSCVGLQDLAPLCRGVGLD